MQGRIDSHFGLPLFSQIETIDRIVGRMYQKKSYPYYLISSK